MPLGAGILIKAEHYPNKLGHTTTQFQTEGKRAEMKLQGKLCSYSTCDDCNSASEGPKTVSTLRQR